MLINLTNHPSKNWDKEQFKEAELKFGEIVDIPFPYINTHTTLQEIMLTVNEYLLKITDLLNKTNNKLNAVHISGEFVFVYNMVKILQDNNIKAITSVTERNVITEANGAKTSIFAFKGFRPYF
jgi:aspartokinase